MKQILPQSSYEVFRWKGRGEATYTDPVGIVSGPAEIYLSDDGRLSVTLTIEDVENGSTDPVDPFDFFRMNGKRKSKLFSTSDNPCVKVMIYDDDFIFISESNSIIPSLSFKSTQDSTQFTISFHVLHAVVKARTATPARIRCIAVPLHGYDQPFEESASAITHWFNWYSEPMMTISSDNGDGTPVQSQSQPFYQRIVSFTTPSGHGFIQPIHNNTNDAAPQSGCGPSAMLVIDVDVATFSKQAILDALPATLFYGLSLVAGKKVGSSIVLAFNESHQLAEAHYIQLHLDNREKWLCPFSFACERASGQLITAIFSSSYSANVSMAIAMRSLGLSGRDGQTSEDKVQHLSRAIEALGKLFVPKRRVDPTLTKEENETVINYMNDIRKIIDGSQIHPEDKDRVKKSLGSVFEIRPSFTDIITGLLRKFSLPDDEILKSIPRWKVDMMGLRGRAAHGGSVDIDDGFYRVSLILHMQDLVCRVIFKALGYEGTYQPPPAKYACAVSIDRLSPTSPPQYLGYDIDDSE